MLFNSWTFILLFLPCVLIVYQLLAASGKTRLLIPWLVVSSLIFYSWDTPRNLMLIVGSAIFNYRIGQSIHFNAASGRTTTGWLAGGIALNLGLLGYFKYSGFFAKTLSDLLEAGWPAVHVALPIGISFFTFQQIAYLVDCRRGMARQGTFMEYVLFVTYFPQLIAGPIVHYREIAPQLNKLGVIRADNLAPAITIFAIGLFKKVGLADSIAPYADQVFNLAASGHNPSVIEAWSGALAYTFQLYFDFSGYADMAIGLGLMIGVQLPVNFDSPYKSRSIIEFWRRWHITLSHFLRDYLYVPLGGNRHGRWRTFSNLLVVMLLGGLWHGAGWTFIIWGGLHGVYLLVNHSWRAIRHHMPNHIYCPEILRHAISHVLTFGAVVAGWVFFRASDPEVAWRMVTAMVDISDITNAQSAGGEMVAASWKWICLLAAIAFWGPNTQQIMGYRGSVMDIDISSPVRWQPSAAWAVATAMITFATFMGLYLIQRPSPFLYFQF